MDIGLSEVFLLVIIILITILLWRRKPRNMPPGPRGWPVVGSLLSLSKDQPFVDMMKLGKAYGGRGNIVTLQLGSSKVVVLNSYEAIKEALVKQGEFFSSRPDSPVFSIVKRKGIVASTYSREWKELRTFALKTLRSFGMGKRNLEGKISEEISFVFEEIDKFISQPYDIRHIINVSVSNLICSIIKGERFDYEDPQFKLLLCHIETIFMLVGNTSIFNFFPSFKYIPFLNRHTKRLRNIVHAFINYFSPLIERHQQEFQEDNVRDLIDAFFVEFERTKNIPNSSFQDKEQLSIVINNLFLAGTETTSNSIYWTILYLVVYPDIQKKVQQEIDRVVGRDRLPALEDEPSLTYTRAVIREIQRLVTIGPLGLPHCSSDNAKLMGYDIPKNTHLLTNIWAVHHDPSIWDEPHSFKPDRFIDDSGNLIKPEEYIPFSMGHRECLGEQLALMQLYLYISSLLHHYSFKIPEGAPVPSLKGKIGLTHFADPYKVIIEER